MPTYQASSYGSYFDYYAASAGSTSSSMATGGATDSVCPYGWTLPLNGETGSTTGNKTWAYLMENKYGLSDNSAGSKAARAYPLSFSLAGYAASASGTINSVNVVGYYWSKDGVYATTHGRGFYVNNTDRMIPQNGALKNFQISIRCIKK